MAEETTAASGGLSSNTNSDPTLVTNSSSSNPTRSATPPLSTAIAATATSAEAAPPRPVVPLTPRVQIAIQNVKWSEVKKTEECDTFFSAGTLKASLRSAGAVLSAVRLRCAIEE